MPSDDRRLTEDCTRVENISSTIAIDTIGHELMHGATQRAETQALREMVDAAGVCDLPAVTEIKHAQLLESFQVRHPGIRDVNATIERQ